MTSGWLAQNTWKIVIALVLLALLGLVGTEAVRIARAEYMDFAPWPASPEAAHPELTGISGLREVRFARADGQRVAGWYAPSRSGAAVILVHGTNTDRVAVLPETRSLAAAGFGVLAIDWAGYGGSTGAVDWGPGERSTLLAALDWLSAQPGIDPKRIGGYGFSMGSYILAQTAALDPRLRAVVLAGVPADIVKDVTAGHQRWGILSEWVAARTFWHYFGDKPGAPSAEQAVALIAPRPVLVIGGSADSVVPEPIVRRVFAAAREPKELWIVPGAQHGAYPLAAPVEYPARLAAFFTKAL